MFDGLLAWLSQAIPQQALLAPLWALIGGLLTSFLPCALSSVPLVMGYVGQREDHSVPKALALSVVFAMGMALTFTALGIMAALAGRLMGLSAPWWYLVLGGLLVLMALQIWGVFQFIPATYLIAKQKHKGYAGAFLAGLLGGLFSSPCATPVLVAVLALVANGQNAVWGGVLLLCYAAGHSFLVILAGTSAGFVKKLAHSGRYGAFSKILNILLGAALLGLALYFFYLGF